MNHSGQKPAASNAPDYAASEFTQELLKELAREHYRLHAWRRFMSRSWSRSLDDIRESPARARSFWSWAGAVAATGAGVIFLTWLYHGSELTVRALTLWLPWYAGSVFLGLTHLGMVDNDRGVPYHNLLLSNGLSFLRLALAPLILWPCLTNPVHPVTGPVFTFFLAGLSLTDWLDGWVARRRDLCTRLGRMLDFLADLSLLTFLAVGLYLAGAIPATLLWLLVVRYPLLLIGVGVLYFARGPAPLAPTLIGRTTTFATHIVLLVVAFKLLLPTNLPPSLWIEWSLRSLYFLIGVNIVYLFYCGFAWAGRGKNHTEILYR